MCLSVSACVCICDCLAVSLFRDRRLVLTASAFCCPNPRHFSGLDGNQSDFSLPALPHASKLPLGELRSGFPHFAGREGLLQFPKCRTRRSRRQLCQELVAGAQSNACVISCQPDQLASGRGNSEDSSLSLCHGSDSGIFVMIGRAKVFHLNTWQLLLHCHIL